MHLRAPKPGQVCREARNGQNTATNQVLEYIADTGQAPSGRRPSTAAAARRLLQVIHPKQRIDHVIPLGQNTVAVPIGHVVPFKDK